MEQQQQPPTKKTTIEGLLGPEVGYIDLLDHHLLEKQARENAEPPRRNPLRPSSSGKCARALAYEFNEFRGHDRYPPEERAPNVIRLLSLGSSIEWNILRQFRDIEFFDVRYQQQVLSFFPISEKEIVEGSIDFVFYLPGHRSIGDVKSKGDKFSAISSSKWDEEIKKLEKMSTVKQISDASFWVEDLPAFLEELNDPFFADNFVQLNLYAMNPFIQERGIDHAFILRYNKNDSRLMEVRFKPSQQVYDYVKDKFQAVANAIDSGAGPEAIKPESFIGSARCAFCRFKTNCWPEFDAKKEFFQTLPAKSWPKDTNRLKEEGAVLEQLYNKFSQADQAASEREQIEQQLCQAMREAGLKKVRFEDGSVFELKFLKSPKPHYELRRSKA